MYAAKRLAHQAGGVAVRGVEWDARGLYKYAAHQNAMFFGIISGINVLAFYLAFACFINRLEKLAARLKAKEKVWCHKAAGGLNKPDEALSWSSPTPWCSCCLPAANQVDLHNLGRLRINRLYAFSVLVSLTTSVVCIALTATFIQQAITRGIRYQAISHVGVGQVRVPLMNARPRMATSDGLCDPYLRTLLPDDVHGQVTYNLKIDQVQISL